MDASPYLSTVVFPDAESELRDPRLFIAALRRQAREYSEQIPSLRRRLALARMQLAAARQGRRGAHVDRMELHQRVADAKVDLGACRAAITALRSWCRELTGNPSTRAAVESGRFTSPTTSTQNMTNASKPPEGTGYVEQSIADRFASMKGLPTDIGKMAARGFLPVGDLGGVPYGYKASSTVAADGVPRAGGK
jgi:hypothetical protein